MAKLEGVKVMDMVNGEITKIAYDGAEYAKVDGRAKIGDLVMTKYSHIDVTNGAFYEVVADRRHGFATIYDDVNEGHSNVISSTQTVAYRKISATSPTIEERVTALENDVAVLKGEQKAAPKRLTVGDIAKVIGTESLHKAKIGDIVKIVQDDKDQHPYRCERVSDGKDVGWFRDSELEAFESDTIEKAVEVANKTKLKAGDFIKFKESRLGITAGKVYEVITYKNGHLVVKDDIGFHDNGINHGKEYEIVSADEAKWAKIGRKVDEYKDGDIIEITRYQWGEKVGSIVKVTSVIPENSAVEYRSISGKSTYVANYDAIKLVAPVESTM